MPIANFYCQLIFFGAGCGMAMKLLLRRTLQPMVTLLNIRSKQSLPEDEKSVRINQYIESIQKLVKSLITNQNAPDIY